MKDRDVIQLLSLLNAAKSKTLTSIIMYLIGQGFKTSVQTAAYYLCCCFFPSFPVLLLILSHTPSFTPVPGGGS